MFIKWGNGQWFMRNGSNVYERSIFRLGGVEAGFEMGVFKARIADFLSKVNQPFSSHYFILKMLEALVASILNRVLGNYVSNLNYDQLKIAIWNGNDKDGQHGPLSPFSIRNSSLFLLVFCITR
jgi:hypothetical protein